MNPFWVFRVPHDQHGIQCHDGRLELVGLGIQILDLDHGAEELEDEEEFELDEDLDEDELDEDDELVEDEEVDTEPAVLCAEGTLVLTNCEVTCGRRPCIELVGSNAVLTQTQLDSETHNIIVATSVSNVLTVRECEFAAESAISLSELASATLELSDTLFEADFAIELQQDASFTGQTTIRATGNQFHCDEAMISVWDAELPADPTTVIQQLPFAWTGGGNTIPAVAVLLDPEDDSRQRIISRSDWKARHAAP